MNKNEWTRRNKGACRVPASKGKKNEGDFNPNHDFVKKAMDDYAKSGGKIKIPVETS